ncbi:hypothetical protein [Halorussus amylolyticus]|uniref:hypothetical protein n=1 Tax=Halorussus amylolyticus TaxID=1126242 RepID=UPI00192F50B9|nr:hypothetical protein [Halorussus amylolyticus]
MRKRMSSNPDRSIKYFGWFTWKDLLRLGLPGTVLAWMTVGQSAAVTLGASFVGGLLGLIWFGVRPNGQPLEVHLYHLLRWIVRGEDQQ